MNEESKTQHCGDSCGAVAAMAVAFREYVPPEQRMATAISQVLSGEMSQRGAAEANGVAETSLRRQLGQVRQMAHPTKPQSSTEVSTDRNPIAGDRTRGDRQRRHKAMRDLAREHGISSLPSGLSVSRAGLGQIHQGLIDLGIDVPEDIAPRSTLPKTKKAITTTSNDQTTESAIDDDTLYIFQADAIRDEVCREVQQSNRPADFKRAIELLRELDVICTDAWYGRQSEPWGTFDWAHVSSEVRKIHSLVNQRAEEACADYLAAQNWGHNSPARLG
jgi:hypothetical protein